MEEIMRQISQQLTEKFKKKLGDRPCSLKDFKYLYLESFLGDYGLRDRTERWHEWIDQVSLSGPEIDYFHQFVDLEESPERFIETAITLYSKVEDLPECQLGGDMLKRLEISKSIVLV